VKMTRMTKKMRTMMKRRTRTRRKKIRMRKHPFGCHICCFNTTISTFEFPSRHQTQEVNRKKVKRNEFE
jgi:hypothetical protein